MTVKGGKHGRKLSVMSQEMNDIQVEQKWCGNQRWLWPQEGFTRGTKLQGPAVQDVSAEELERKTVAENILEILKSQVKAQKEARSEFICNYKY